MAYHVHRLARLGPPMLISGNWYYHQYRRFAHSGKRKLGINKIVHINLSLYRYCILSLALL